MIHVIETHNAAANQALLDGMFRLRARIFRDKLRWTVAVRDGMEKDRFDEEDPVYIVHTDGNGFVNGSCRLLPTTGPTLVEEAFADTVPDIAQLSSPFIWECTRLCVDRSAGVAVSGALIAAIGRLAIAAGIDTILGNFDATMLHIYKRLGCDVTVLGNTLRYGRPVFLGSFPVRQDILDVVVGRIDEMASRLVAA